jgi:outer membrane protein assembly factor BamB
LTCLLLALTLAPSPAPAEANWPQWRGPTNNGISPEKGLPTKWSEKEGVAWKIDLPGEGYSTPIVWGDRIFLTSRDTRSTAPPRKGRRGEVEGNVTLLCISTAGKELWKRDLGKAIPSGRADEGNAASPSPATDGKAVYTFSGNGTFAAFDFAGKQLWRFDAQERYGKFRIAFGIHSTPVLHEGKLYFQLIHENAALVVCVNAADGKQVWKVKRESDGTAENLHSYASPFMWSNGKDAYLVTHGCDYAIAYALADGKEIWRVAGLNPQGAGYRRDLRFVASPACTPDLIVVPSAKNKSIVGLKPNGEGRIEPGSKYEKWRLTTGTPDVPSPIIHDGLVYLAGEGGTLTVLKADDGKQLYKRPVGKGRHRANPVLGDGKVYIVGRDSGTVNVVKAGTTFELLASNKLPDIFGASPAVAGGRIYLRGLKSLWAIGAK